MGNLTSERHQVVVIGAGQSGLAAGYHLARRGLDFVILESAKRVGDVWRDRYDSLRLYSPAGGDALPGMAFPLPPRDFPTGRQMGDYLEAYAVRQGLPVRTGVRVLELRRGTGTADDGAFLLRTSAGELAADQVILATGPFQVPKRPDFAAELDPGIRQLHAAEYRGPRQLAPGPVLVVGLSHSGSDIAHEVALAGHPTIVSGRLHGQLPFAIDSRRGRYIAWPLMRFLGSTVLTLSTPVGRRMAPKVRRGHVPLLRNRRPELVQAGVDLREARTVGVQDGRPMLADGSVLEVANVIWCTGFRPDYGWVRLPMEMADGWPVQRRGVVGSVPGLYLLGMPFLHSFTSMLVVGAGRDAKRVVERVAQAAARARQGASRAEVESSAA